MYCACTCIYNNPNYIIVDVYTNIKINFIFYRYLLLCGQLIGERREPHTYRTAEKNLRHIYIYVFYIYIYIYTFVRRARAVHARATRKRRTGRLRFNGQYNRLKNGYFSSKL